MPITVRAKVLRHMTGDKDYAPGDFRTLSAADAERLEATGAIEIVSKPTHQSAKPKAPKKARGAKPAAKKAAAPKNKMKAAPANKAR